MGRRPRWSFVAAAVCTLLVFGSGFGPLVYAHRPHRCPPELVGDAPILSGHLVHEDIVAGKLTLEEILDAGKRLFTAPFNLCDGQGRPAATGSGAPTKRVPGAPHFLRTSAPDANSCAGCHNDPAPGGAGDFVANVFVLAQTLDPVTFSVSSAFSNERNTLGMHGAGAIELLARGMTAELQATRARAIQDAQRTGQAVTRPLITKGVHFGRITAFADGSVDTSRVEGVDPDLVIRPFHQSGGVVSIREFTVNAMNHHHGMQAVERFGRARTGEDDFDEDGVRDELSIGDITAVTLFQAALGVPGRLIPRSKEQAIAAGEETFNRIGCATCHVPALVLNNATFCEPNPLNPPGTFNDTTRSVCFDLTRDGPKPRPEALGTGAVIRAFTDLKRHVICDDQDPHFCNERLLPPGGRKTTAGFLTRKIWDVGNTAPYGHRGDLTTISEAILAHGAEGRAARDAFAALSAKEKEELLEFLKSLRVLPEGSDRIVFVD